MKTRFFFAALLLLAFGTAKAQDTVTAAPKQADPAMIWNMPDMSQLPELLRELGVNLQHLTDSVDWKSFEKDMEKWGSEMEEWGRKMERWGEEFEGAFESPSRLKSSGNPDDPVKAIHVGGSGDVRIRQSQDGFSLSRGDKETRRQPFMANGTLILGGPSDYEVAIPQLNEIIMSSSGDVIGRGVIKGDNLNLVVSGSGDLKLDVDYDTIRVLMSGSGDVTLMGQCKMIYADIHGSGDLKIQQLIAGESHINATGSGEAWVNKEGNVTTYHQRKAAPPVNRGLLFDAHWNGFEAGLNMLFNPNTDVTFVDGSTGNIGLAIRPMRSWYFGFNIADVGVAFNRKHTAGLFTGVGIGWNNFSWKEPVVTLDDPHTGGVTNTLLPDTVSIKNSKLGLLYLQIPLMVEIRPTRNMYIDMGVTGGLRFSAWSKVKYADGRSTQKYSLSDSPFVNRFKLDASFRIGSNDIGFFANYALLPIYRYGSVKNSHPLSFGFSINF